ncbi:MAG: hypothetical protein WDA47_08340 [Bacilli bacterium]
MNRVRRLSRMLEGHSSMNERLDVKVLEVYNHIDIGHFRKSFHYTYVNKGDTYYFENELERNFVFVVNGEEVEASLLYLVEYQIDYSKDNWPIKIKIRPNKRFTHALTFWHGKRKGSNYLDFLSDKENKELINFLYNHPKLKDISSLMKDLNKYGFKEEVYKLADRVNNKTE